MSSYANLREQVLAANLELPARGVVNYTFGNVSAADRNRGIFAIKPSGVPYANLGLADIVVLDFDGNVVEGTLTPSSDTPTHAVLYRHFSDIGAIAHTHSPWATAWAQAELDVPIMGTTHADLCAGDIPCTRVMTAGECAGDYEEETGRLIVERFTDLDPARIPMVLVARHGPFAWGRDATEAVYHVVMCEELARNAGLTVAIAPGTTTLPECLQEKHFERKHGPDAYYGQEEDLS